MSYAEYRIALEGIVLEVDRFVEDESPVSDFLLLRNKDEARITQTELLTITQEPLVLDRRLDPLGLS